MPIDWSGYFYNASCLIQEKHSQAHIIFFEKPFFPRLFFGKPKYLTPLIGILVTMLVKKAGLGLQNPVTSADENCLSLRCASMEQIWDMQA